MWLVFSILAGALYTAESLLQRFHLRKQKDVWTFALFYCLIGSLVSLPFMLASPKAPSEPGLWLLSLLVGLLIVGNNLLFFKATGLIEVSLLNSLLKLRLVWVFIFGILFLSEPFSWEKLAGTLLAILAGWLIIHNLRRISQEVGSSYTGAVMGDMQRAPIGNESLDHVYSINTIYHVSAPRRDG